MEWGQLCVGESQAGGGQDEKALKLQKQLRFVGSRKKRFQLIGTRFAASCWFYKEPDFTLWGNPHWSCEIGESPFS
jgi:hypothetical protein